MEIKNIFSRTRFQTLSGGESMTEQNHVTETNINEIIARSRRTGMLPINQAEGIYGDFTSVADYHETQNRLKEAETSFLTLPASIRSRFKNSPAYLIEFLSDEENRAEAIKLGLITPKADVVTPQTPVEGEKAPAVVPPAA